MGAQERERVAEAIDGFSVATSTTQVLGAMADFNGYLRQAAAGIRSRQRLPDNARLRALVPAWLPDFLAADASHSHAGDGLDRYLIDRDFVTTMFARAGCNVSYYADTASSVGTAMQQFGPQGVGDLQNFSPTPGVTNSRCIMYLYVEGSFAYVDGGRLDLGLVRDSVLNQTNDAQFFAESWQALAPKVIESLKVVSTLCMSGVGATDASSSAYCTAS